MHVRVFNIQFSLLISDVGKFLNDKIVILESKSIYYIANP